jgi:glycylpeptide N-tetradecanoyltransferase
MVEINFLCIHKKLRSKRLAPVLIKEITRRVNLTGVFQAVYTAGTVLPVPVASCRYYHRSLNPKKLVRVGFSRLGHRMTMARMQKLYKLPDQPQSPGLRPMQPDDVEQVHKLLMDYLQNFSLRVVFSKEEVAHWLLPREGVINSYVVVRDDGKVTDFLSFYHLPSSILNHNDKLFAAYSYYNVATSMDLADLMKDGLILAKAKGCDVFNALNLMDNQKIMDVLKFGIGDGKLQYYIYNWACPEMPPEKVGIVLL